MKADPIEPNIVLRARIADNLADDEEYLDEIHHGCNYVYVETNGEEESRRLHVRFRLAEIMVELDHMIREGLVASRTDPGWPESAGITCVFFRLTDVGRAYWRAHVKDTDRDRLYA